VPWRHLARARELQLAPTAKLILYALASRADDRGCCWPSVAQICRDTGLQRRAVQIHLRRLVDTRLVVRELSAGRAGTLRLLLDDSTQATKESPRDPRTSCAPPPALYVRSPAHFVRPARARGAPEVTSEVPMNPQIPRGPTFRSPDYSSASNASAWWISQEGIMAKGRELDLPPRPGENLSDYKARIFRRLDCPGDRHLSNNREQCNTNAMGMRFAAYSVQ
jgi:hypothetical protein